MTHGKGSPGGATLEWLGCATFRLRVAGTVIFLDAYIDRFPTAPGPDIRTADIDRADWIVVGHSHFDHLWGAERIAVRTGAVIIGSYETVRIMEREGVPAAQLIAVSGGERVRLADGISVSVYPSLHSATWTHRFPAAGEHCAGDLGLTYQDRLTRQQARNESQGLGSLGPEYLAHFQASDQHPRGDGGPLVYLFETPEGSLFYQDTSGCWSNVLTQLRPDVAILAAAGRPVVDGEPMQGSLADFVAMQAQRLQTNQVILSHHDDFLPGRSTPAAPDVVERALHDGHPGSRLRTLQYGVRHQVFGETAASLPR